MNDKNYSTHEELLEELDDPKYNSFLYKWGIGDHSLYGILKNPLCLIEDAFYQIKWAWQRVFRGWDDRVVWSIDQHLSEKIPVWLDVLKKTKSGLPATMFDEDAFQPPDYSASKESWARAEEKWNKTLDIISEGFQAYIKIMNEVPQGQELIDLEEKFQIGFDLFKDCFRDLWD